MPFSERAEFLADHELRPVTLEGAEGLRPRGLVLGQGRQPLEVVIVEAARQPGRAGLQKAWKRRHGGRAVPLLLVALHGGRAAKQLREVLDSEELDAQGVSRALVQKVRELGLRPYEAPQPLPVIDEGEVQLVAWMGVETGMA